MLGPFATARRRTPPVLHWHSPGVATVAPSLSYAACASMSTTTTTTTTTRDRGDRYSPMEWAQQGGAQQGIALRNDMIPAAGSSTGAYRWCSHLANASEAALTTA